MAIVLDLLFYAVIGRLFAKIAASALIVLIDYLLSYSIMFVGAFVYFEIRARWWRRYRRRLIAPEPPGPKWKVVTQLTPSDDVSRCRLYPVVLCDVNPIDDPMFPDVSLLHVVEIRQRNYYWYTITIRRISMLTGRQTKVCEFQHLTAWYFSRVDVDDFDVDIFQSRGVIFIRIQNAADKLFVFDTRFDVKAEYRFERPSDYLVNPIVIACLGRRCRNVESIDGWRVRFVSVCRQEYDHAPACFMNNVVFDLLVGKKKFERICKEDIVFLRQVHTLCRIVRSPTKFGCFVEIGEFELQTFVYNVETNAMEAYNTLAEFYESEAPLRRYRNAIGQSPFRFNCPEIITDRESVVIGDHDVVYRTSFTAPTLRMATTRYIFRMHPEKKISRIKFRESYGIDLPGHLA